MSKCVARLLRSAGRGWYLNSIYLYTPIDLSSYRHLRSEKVDYDAINSKLKACKLSLQEHLGVCKDKAISAEFAELMAIVGSKRDNHVAVASDSEGSDLDLNTDLREEFEEFSSDDDDYGRVLNDEEVKSKNAKRALIKLE